MSTSKKIIVASLAVACAACRQHPGLVPNHMEGQSAKPDMLSKQVARPDANTVVLVADAMTFRRVTSKKGAADFFLLETEVTNEMYERYLKTTGKMKGDWEQVEAETRRQESDSLRLSSVSPVYDFDNSGLLWRRNSPPPGFENHPVAFLTIGDAREFCVWLTRRYSKAGRFRLPTVEEWVMAAYGDTRNYPWGDQRDLGVSCVSSSQKALRTAPTSVKTHVKDRTPEGIYDLGGNVAEFVIDLKDFPSDTRWMGASFKTYPLEEDGHPFTPRNDYWGYCHSTDSRMEDTGFRVLLELLE